VSYRKDTERRCIKEGRKEEDENDNNEDREYI
jgi:hypothetical protein